MRILHVSAVKNWGGGEKHIIDLCQTLQRLHPQIQHSIICKQGDEFHHLLKQEGLHPVPAPLSFKLDPRYIGKLLTICREDRFDLLHIHDSTALALAVIADHLAALPPFVFSKKTSFPIRQRWLTRYKYDYHKIKRILCVSKETCRITRNAVHPSQDIQVIYHGTREDNKSSKTPFRIRERLRIPDKAVVIGNIANHIEAKDLKTMVRTAALLVSEESSRDLHFVQIGKFSRLTADLRCLVAKFKLESRFHFLGYLPKASNFIPQFDCTLLTSEMEGVPQVIYESFFHEVPVISTAAGGIPEVLVQNKTGFLAQVHDAQGLARQVTRCLSDPDLSRNVTRTARERMFTSRSMALHTYEVYRDILSEK